MMLIVFFLSVLFVLFGCENQKCTIVFHSNCEQVVPDIVLTKQDNSIFSPPEIYREGYTFDGWYIDESYVIRFSDKALNSKEVHLFAKWISNSYRITILAKGETIEYTYKCGDCIQLGKVVSNGYIVDGYYYDEALSEECNLLNMPAHDLVLYPRYIDDPSNGYVQYYVNEREGRLIGEAKQLIAEDEITKEVEVEALDGFRFVGWSDGVVNRKRSDSLCGNNVYAAIFERVYNLTIIVNNEAYGRIEGQTTQYLAAGETSSEIKAVPNIGYKFKSWSNGTFLNSVTCSIEEDSIICANFEIDSLSLPIIEIFTENNKEIVSKDDYIKCAVSLCNAEKKYTFDLLDAKIKGRGNSTWAMPKKPYKLKFANKVDLFGKGAAKTWVFLANYTDKSLVRNDIVFAIADELDVEYTTSRQWCELFVNGQYEGVYLICEQVEVDKERVDISENMQSVDTGYLLELDNRFYKNDEGKRQGYDFFEVGGNIYVIKSPDTEGNEYSAEFTDFIKTYITNCMLALEEDWSSTTCLINVDSFAKAYVVYELSKVTDVGYTSFYLYKDDAGKLNCGPLWDFDISIGNVDVIPSAVDPKYLYAKENNIWFEKLLNKIEFVNIVESIIKNMYNRILESIATYCDAVIEYKDSVDRNYVRWNTWEQKVAYETAEIMSIKTWEGQIEYLRTWLLKSLDYIYNYYVNCSDSAYSITINNGDNHSINIFNTIDLSSPTIVINNAWSRDLTTGELLKDGNGGIIFQVACNEGYRIKSVAINDNAKYVSLDLLDENNGIYKITGISGDIAVTVEVEDDVEEPPAVAGYNITFVHNTTASIMVYPGKDYSIDGDITDSSTLEDMSGDGQVNFKVILQEGYEIESINIEGSYKNLKGPSDTGVENVYRVTKVAGDLIITITTREIV